MLLENEKIELRDNLDIALSEIETYDEFIEHFPEEKQKLTNLKSQAKHISIEHY